MKSFKSFVAIMEGVGSESRQRLSDFLGHLAAGSHSPGDRSVTFDTLHEGVSIVVRHQSKTPDLTQHPAVNQTRPVEDAEAISRYRRLMDNGARIGQEIPKLHAHIERGFKSYMSGVGSGHNSFEDPRVTQRKELTSSRKFGAAYMKEKAGYTSGMPKFIGGNTKTEKNVEKGDITAGLSLSPANIHGMGEHNACPNSSTECRNSCLAYTTGQNAMLSNINSKIVKHHFFSEHPEHAARIIHAELLNHVDNVAQWNSEKGPDERKLIASFRPNMVSDYNIRKTMPDMLDHVTEHAKRLGVHFQIRDYTKNHQLLNKPRPSNHFLALSSTGPNKKPDGSVHKESNDSHVAEALHKGHTVAAVVEGDATHMYDHKMGRLYPIDEGDYDDQIETGHKNVGHITIGNGTGIHPKTKQLTGVVRALRMKGGSNKTKEAGGAFIHHTTTIQHPVHGTMRVAEINRP